jgi:hypothetical protein
MAVNWYNPNQKRTNYTAVPGAGNPNAARKVGNLTTEQLLDPSLGFGVTFQASANQGRVEALKNAMSQANPEDYQGMDELRDYYRGKLGDLPTTENNRVTSFDTQSQRGLSNILAQNKAAQAGTGSLGTRQFAGAQGDIVSRLTNDYMQGLANEKARSLQDAQAIQGGLSGVQNQDLQERQFQYNQGKGLSDLYTTMINQDQNREGQVAKPEDSGWISDVLPAVGTIAGAAIGGPAGAMIGGSIGGAVGSATGNKGGAQAGMTSGMGLANVLAQQQAMNNYKMPAVSTPGQSAGYMAPNSYGYRAPTVGGANGYYGGYY